MADYVFEDPFDDSTVDNNDDNMSITTTSTHSDTQRMINHTKKSKGKHTIDFDDV